MNYRQVMSLFVPPIVGKLKNRLMSKRDTTTLPMIEHDRDSIILVGSGPSLKVTLDKSISEFANHDVMVCNYFANTDYYSQIKPKLYILADPMFGFPKEKEVMAVENLKRVLIEKTKWYITLIIPSEWKTCDIAKLGDRSQYISVVFYNSDTRTIDEDAKFEAWDKNSIAPPRQTVMNVALYISLYWGYKETYLVGVDTSFLEDIKVDQRNNTLFTLDKHFYDNKEIYIDDRYFNEKIGKVLTGRKLYDFVFNIGKMLKGYHDLKEYADYKGLKVYNASEYSWIDCFERKKLNTLL